jgi:acyl-CoA synthetase (AMP-forming)/AMP-acid ligase II
MQGAPSYVAGTSEQPLLYRSVGGVLSDAAAKWPDTPALIVRHQSVRWSYRELDRQVSEVARGLVALGLQPGDRVGIWSPNNAQWVLTQFATARAGLILVNINPAYRASELAYVLRKVGCRALILAPAHKSSDYVAILRELIPELTQARGPRLRCGAFPALEYLIHLGPGEITGMLAFGDLPGIGSGLRRLPDAHGIAEPSPQDVPDQDIDPDQPVNIQFTSGTTGSPKGATLTHFNIVNNAYFVARGMLTRPGDRICVPVPICYGMTETSPVSFQSGIDDALEKRVTTVGRIHPYVQVKLVDANGRVVPRGSCGELLTRGYNVMRGYWDDPEQTAECIDSAGWMHTGDLAILDEEGYCSIAGRVKDMIIRGGENIYPREIEEHLLRHPKILEVAVVGVPDRQYGEVVCAVIRLRERVGCSEQEIIDYCRGQIAHYKVPRFVRFVDGFPMTVTGKMQKYLIREQQVRELNIATGDGS